MTTEKRKEANGGNGKRPSTEQTEVKNKSGNGRNSNGTFGKGNKLGKQVQPGQTLNPNGPPKARMEFYRWYTKYMMLTMKELDELEKKNKDDLTIVQMTAIAEARKSLKGKAVWLLKQAINREEGGETVDVSIEQKEERVIKTLLVVKPGTSLPENGKDK